jgi:endo-1,4-beta-xylanase
MSLYRLHRWEVGLSVIVVICILASQPPARGADTQKIEAEFLAKAEKSMEQHRKAEAVISFKDGKGQAIAGTPVQVRQVTHEFLFGCIAFDLVRGDQLYKSELWKQRFSDLFNFAVFPFYWAGYERQPGITPREETLDAVKWCRERGITTKGHPLVWTNPAGIPEWVRQYPPERSEELVLNRVRREVSGFAGQIDIWDVVNEPIHCRTWKDIKSRDYVQEPIPAIADYVDKAFRAAHEANPKAHLILNEFNVVSRAEDRERFYQLVAELKRRGTPISGLGIQAHEPREEWFSPEKVWTTLDRLGSLGFPLHITEYIPQSGGKPITGGWREGTWTEQAQAEFAEQFYRLCFGHPAVASINWWGLSDRQIWLPAGGLIDKEYEPKPVYNRLRDLIHRQWKTSLDVQTDAKGQVTFRGFCGAYDIAIKLPDGKSQTSRTVLQKGHDNQYTFTVE